MTRLTASVTLIPTTVAETTGRTERRPRTLRRTVGTVTAVATVTALVVCGALILFTTELHRSTRALGGAVESIRQVEEVEVELLLHTRATDPFIDAALAADLRRQLIETRRFVSTGEERRIFERAEAGVTSYLSAAEDPSATEEQRALAVEPALSALESLVDVNVAQARAARQEADAWDRAANVVGIALAGVLMLIAVVVLWWLHARALRPILHLVGALGRFRTDRNARASESGPAELRQLAGQFNAMADELARREQEKQTFLAGVAHDLRSPLQALHLALGQVDPAEPMPPEPRTRQLFAMVTRQVTRIERMLGDLLDTARAEAGQLEICKEPRDVRELVRDVAELFEAASPVHRFDLALPGNPSLVDCDPGRIAQVLTNLVQNAIKYSPDGGAIRIEIENGAGEVTISVADQGVGIPRDEQAAVFEPYQRSRATRTTIPGAGLGLFVVRRIVEAHGGRIDVSSSPAAGSTFSVRLPTRDERQPGAP